MESICSANLLDPNVETTFCFVYSFIHFSMLSSLQNRKRDPSGGTCPSTGFKAIRKEIQASEPGRVKAVVFVTDGDITVVSEQKATKNQMAGIRGLDHTSMFGVTVGNLDKQARNILLNNLGGDKAHLFSAYDASALDGLINLMSSLLINLFEINYLVEDADVAFAKPYAQDPASFDYGTCFGNNPPISLKGSSIDLLALNHIKCVFKHGDEGKSRMVLCVCVCVLGLLFCLVYM